MGDTRRVSQPAPFHSEDLSVEKGVRIVADERYILSKNKFLNRRIIARATLFGEGRV